MSKFRKKPEAIEAIQWTGKNISAVMEFMLPEEPTYMEGFSNRDEIVGIQTLAGLVVASLDDWIIRGVKGELYPCKPDIFELTYDAVEQ